MSDRPAARLEACVKLHALRNVDLFQKGLYRVRVLFEARTLLGSAVETTGPSHVEQTHTLARNPRSIVDGSVISDSHVLGEAARLERVVGVEGSSACSALLSRAVHVRYRNEAFVLDDAVRFAVAVDEASAASTGVALTFELLYAGVDGAAEARGAGALRAFECVAQREVRIPAPLACEGVHEFHSVVWDRMHFGALDVTLHTALLRGSGSGSGAETSDASTEHGSESVPLDGAASSDDGDGDARFPRGVRRALARSSRAALVEECVADGAGARASAATGAAAAAESIAATPTRRLWRQYIASKPSAAAVERLRTRWMESLAARWFEHTLQERSAVAPRGLWIPQDRVLAQTHAKVGAALRKSVRGSDVRARPPVMDMSLPWRAADVPVGVLSLLPPLSVCALRTGERPPRVDAAPRVRGSSTRASASLARLPRLRAFLTRGDERGLPKVHRPTQIRTRRVTRATCAALQLQVQIWKLC